MDDTADPVDVHAASGDVGRDQRVHLARPERPQRSVALRLAAAAVDRRRLHAQRGELLGQAVGAVPGAAEHHRRTERPHDVSRAAGPVGPIELPEHVPGRRDVRSLGSDLVAHRTTLDAAGQLGHGAVERRREQEDLALRVGLVEQALDRRQEPHVGHPVGLVDHDLADVAQVDGTEPDEILETAGAGDDELDAGVERLALRAVADTAIDGGDVMTAGPRQRPELTCDLVGELPRRCQHEGGGPPTRRGSQADDDGDAEAEGLAGARRGPAGDVPPGERVGDDGGLDRERSGDAGGIEARAQIGGHAERGEPGVGLVHGQ